MSSIVNSALPSGSGTAREFEMPPVGEGDAPAALLPLDRRRADQLGDQRRRAPGVASSVATAFGQRIDPRMAAEERLVEAPQRAEPVVPQLQPAVGGEHPQRLEQIVERRGAHAQQRVARAGELDLLGAILEDQQQPAVGQRLRDDAQMRAAGQMPCLLDRAVGAATNQSRRSAFQPGKSRTSGSRLASRIRSSTRSNSGRSASHSLRIANMRRNGWLQNTRRGRAPNCATPADSRSSIARCASAKRLMPPRACSSSSMSIAKPGDAAGRQRHVVDAQHPPLAADRRGQRRRLRLPGRRARSRRWPAARPAPIPRPVRARARSTSAASPPSTAAT